MASVLTPDTQPAYLLYLELPPTKFDINVHPTKQEVRFSEPRAVHDFICSAITHGALTGLQPEVAQIRLRQQQPESSVANVSGIEPKLKNSLWPQPSGSKVSTNQVRQQLRTYQLMTEQGTQNILGDAVAQLFGQYLITRAQDSWYLIHIARARVALARQALQQQKIDSQPLLVPETLSAPRRNQDSMQSLAKFLQAYGFSIGQIGESQWLIRRIPLVLRYFDSSRLKTMLIEFAGAETEPTLDALICALGPAQVASTNLSTEEKMQLVSACGAYLQSLPTHPLPDFVLPIGADWLETQFADPA
jgi:DNA mismatch repair protein MutL